MSEADAIDRVDDPVTVDSLVEDLDAMGVAAGDALLVHSSMSAIGWAAGGAPAVVDALQQTVTEAGTLVMPTHTGHYLEPSDWENPPIPEDWIPVVHESIPPFRPEVTPTRGMGAIAECFRNYPAVQRSSHPGYSFAAWGADAETVVADHGLDYGLGDGSPLARVYDLDGDVLLLGVGHESNTSLHLAEHRADIDLPTIESAGPILRDGERVYAAIEDLETDTSDFPDVGAAFETDVGVESGSIGAAESLLASQRALVDYAVDWFEANR